MRFDDRDREARSNLRSIWKGTGINRALAGVLPRIHTMCEIADGSFCFLPSRGWLENGPLDTAQHSRSGSIAFPPWR